MEFVGARLKPNLDNAGLKAAKDVFCKKPTIQDATAVYLGWVRPLAVRCGAGHSNSAVGLQLTTIPVTPKVQTRHRWCLAHDWPTQPDLDR